MCHYKAKSFLHLKKSNNTASVKYKSRNHPKDDPFVQEKDQKLECWLRHPEQSYQGQTSPSDLGRLLSQFVEGRHHLLAELGQVQYLCVQISESIFSTI